MVVYKGGIFMKKLLALLTSLQLILLALDPIKVAEKPSTIQTKDQPFVSCKTGESENFRIPAMVTLNNGRIVVAADARYNNSLDGGGLDTIVAYSDDNGANWCSYDANYLGDNGNKFNKKSTAFIDPALLTDGENVWLITTFYPGNRNLGSWTGIKAATGDDAFNDDGTLKLSKNYGLNYRYKVDLNAFKDGYSPILDKNGNTTDYKIDEYFYLYDKEGKQLGNIFYVKSKTLFSVVPTTYLYLTKSTDGGESFGTPTLLNLKNDGEEFYGVGPGHGLCTKNGTLIFSAYKSTSKGVNQATSFIYSKDGGKTWQRSENLPTVSSESQAVELPNGNIRTFYRNNTGKLCYADATETNNGFTWSTPVVTDINTSSTCMVTAISYSKGSKNYILVSCPTGSAAGDMQRTNGKLFTFEVENDGSMELVKTTKINDSTFQYSCLSVLNNGDIALLYENDTAKITFTIYPFSID